MDPTIRGALSSWDVDPLVIVGLVAIGAIYTRGWRKLHQQRPSKYKTSHLRYFLSGLFVLLIALESPLDALNGLLLQVHMIQHLLLMVVAPPLLWMGQPIMPLLRGVPYAVLRYLIGPILGWRVLKRLGHVLTAPLVCWLAMSASTVVWHLPRFFELALRSEAWHNFEHACFFYASSLFWLPVIEVRPWRMRITRWLVIPYLLATDLVNTGLSAYLVFSSHVLYPTYAAGARPWHLSAMADQVAAGAIMWVPGSAVYLIAAVVVAVRALGNGRPSYTVVRASAIAQ